MADTRGGTCARRECDQRAGHGPGNMFCANHATLVQRDIGDYLTRHQRVHVHDGDPQVLPCGHPVRAGDLVIGGASNWMCTDCARATSG